MDQEVGATPLINSKNHGPASSPLAQVKPMRAYCLTCGVYLAGGMVERSDSDADYCCECEP